MPLSADLLRKSPARHCMNRAMSSAPLVTFALQMHWQAVIDPIRLRARAPGKRKRVDLCRRQLESGDPCIGKVRPEHPFMATRSLKPHFDRTRYLPDHSDQRNMAVRRVGMPEPPMVTKAEPAQPAARYVYPNEGCLSSHVTLFSLCFAVPQNGPPSTVRDGEERRDQPVRERGQATRCLALYPTPSPVLAGSGNGAAIAGARHIRCLIPASGGSDLG